MKSSDQAMGPWHVPPSPADEGLLGGARQVACHCRSNTPPCKSRIKNKWHKSRGRGTCPPRVAQGITPPAVSSWASVLFLPGALPQLLSSTPANDLDFPHLRVCALLLAKMFTSHIFSTPQPVVLRMGFSCVNPVCSLFPSLSLSSLHAKGSPPSVAPGLFSPPTDVSKALACHSLLL